MKKLNVWIIFFSAVVIVLISALSASYYSKANMGIRLTEAKIAAGVDDKYMPVDARNIFPASTTRVFCWFSWKNAKKDMKITAKWRYATDDISVLNYTFTIPRKDGAGSVSLSMPEGKVLPSGLYQVGLFSGDRQLKSLTFKVK